MGQPFPGRWTFERHPWLRALHDSKAQVNVVQKSAQMGATEAVLNISFFCIDVLGKDVLYVLPNKMPDASVFSSSRFDVALEESVYLKNLFSDVKNINHKRAGSRNLYVRGSKSRAGLKAIPVYLIVLDELDEMYQKNIPLALERTAGQTDFKNWLISTPTIDGFGINVFFQESTQNHYFFRCPGCNRFITLQWPDNIVITSDDPTNPAVNQSHYICIECGKVLNHNEKIEYYKSAQWVPKKVADNEGWYINRMYATVPIGNPVTLAKKFLHSLNDQTEEQEFYNSTLGLPHIVKGGQITDFDLNECIRPYFKFDHRPKDSPLVTMGIDQGALLHYEIDQWRPLNNDSNDLSNSFHCNLLTEGYVNEYSQLDSLFQQFQVDFAVIDAQPERRKATEFANKHYGKVRVCFYPEGINTKQIHLSDAGYEPQVAVDRTTWLDTSLGRFRNRTISLPQNISYDYKNHIKALVRRYERDKNGNPIGRYRRGGKDDHLAHARNYSEIALHLVAAKGSNQNLTNIL